MDHQLSSRRGGGPTSTTLRQQILNISKESHAIKKPSALGPPPAQEQGSRVIHYKAPAKIIDCTPSEFRALVQRLTGPRPSSLPLPPVAKEEKRQANDDDIFEKHIQPPEKPISPYPTMSTAARLATIERSVRPIPKPPLDLDYVTDDDGTLAAVLGPSRSGILSPLPSSLPPAAASGAFSPPPFGASSISWLSSLGPLFRASSTPGAGYASGASRLPPPPSYYSNPFVPKSRYLVDMRTIPSPTMSTEFFASLPDLSRQSFNANSFSFEARNRSYVWKQNWTHGTASTDELRNAAERCLAKGTGSRSFYEGEAGTTDVESDVSEVKVAKRQRLASNQFHDVIPRLKVFVNAVKFIVRMKDALENCRAKKRYFSSFFEDVKTWIDIRKQYDGGLRHHTCVQQVAPELLGTNDIKEMIMGKILFGSNRTVICIKAFCGFGKTSLLRVLYNDQRVLDAFDKRIWIQMSDKFDIIMLFRHIVESAVSNHCSITQLSYLQEMVREEITDKKVALFLDDAEKEDHQFWNSVLEILNVSARGSVVVMATSSYTVAALTGVSTHSYVLNPLSEENKLMLLQQYAALGTDIQSIPDLTMVAKRFISRFGIIPLNLKAIGGLLCHIDSISLSENVKLEASFLPLKLYHDVLPICLKNCLAFCSLFPEGYIYDKHHLVHLWISHGWVSPDEESELEDVGAEYFNELQCRSFFQNATFHNGKDGKFVMHKLFYKMIESASRNRYFKSEDLPSDLPENILHLSLVPSQVQTVHLMSITENLKDLQTFLVLQSEGQQYKVSFPTLELICLDDFFLKFTSLKALDLSHTDIKELPESIISMRNLQYLSVKNTSIKALPSGLCSLSDLQILNVRDCRFLTELPGDTKKLLRLRHLDVTKDLGYVHLPHGIGHLTELRTLEVFHASGNPSHCCISELGNLHKLRGCLQLSGLDCVTSSKAQEVNLKDKQHLKNLTLQWHDGDADIDSDDDEAEHVAEQVLKGLEPHANLQELAVRGYEGTAFPSWMQGPSSLPSLVSLTLDGCCNCTQFPAIAQLPSLKFLGVRKMYDVQQLCRDVNGVVKFPSLELLNLWEMYGLEELFQASEGDCPRLRKICVSRCPNLKRLPCIPSVAELVLHFCHQLPHIPELGPLASLKIEDCHSIKSFSLTPAVLPKLKKLEIRSCSELSCVHGLEALTTVERLKITSCPKLVLPITSGPAF